MRCLKFENQENPVNQRESHRGRKRIFEKSTEVAQSRTGVKSFDGTPTSYLSFMAVFDEMVGNVNIGGQAKLTRLLQYTMGTARVAIDCCALIGGDQGYNEARRILGERFGDPYIITTALIEKLKQQRGSAHWLMNSIVQK